MSTGSDYISRVGQEVIGSLQSDLVSVGELKQIISSVLPDKTGSREFVVEVIRHLLTEGVEIGEARNSQGTYVKFIAWKGSVGDLCERAIRQIESRSAGDQAFVFLLCLRSNVDEADEDKGSRR
ncbi:MAG TPA: hypothetical protein VHP11_11215 [Tepidisphaeraceae bacterium]|nr:hypothetical protein [Tepidisphaeraceae bacterium]